MSFTSTSTRAVLGAMAFAAAANGLAVGSIETAVQNLISTRGIQTPIQGMPGCSVSDNGKPDNNDPTWAPNKSNYTDGEGYFLGNDCDNNKGSDPQHCWTDYFLVGTTQQFGSWYQRFGDVNCAKGTGDSCTLGSLDANQSCTSYSWGASEELSAKIGVEDEGITAELGVSLTTTQTTTNQYCNTETVQNTCTWGADGGCHSAWVAPLVATVHGYTRRSCNSALTDTSGNMPFTAKRADGFYTRGMMDFAIPIVKSNTLNCDGGCSGAPPALSSPNNGTLVPWGANQG